VAEKIRESRAQYAAASGRSNAPVDAAAGAGPTVKEPHKRLIYRWLEEKSNYHPDLQNVVKATHSLTDDPSKIKDGASFITPDGQYSYLLPGSQHPDLIEWANPERAKGGTDNRPSFLNDTGAVRTRFTVGRGGPTLAVSVPEGGVTEPQVEAIRKALSASI